MLTAHKFASRIALTLTVGAALVLAQLDYYYGTPSANGEFLQVGAPMGAPINLAVNGYKMTTHRRNDMRKEVLSCMYNAGNFFASHDKDKFAIGVVDLNSMPFSFFNMPAGGITNCGQCFLFTHKSGRQAIGVASDNCAQARNCQGVFDISNEMSKHLKGDLLDNIYNSDLSVVPVSCNWGKPMRYVLLNASSRDQWYLHIQRNNVPIRSVQAHWTESNGRRKFVEGKQDGGKWWLHFVSATTSGPGNIGKTVELVITGINGEVVKDAIYVTSLPAPYDENDLFKLAALPPIEGKAQFTKI